jgi:DNA-directed RNA polymerase subunit omega
LSKSYNTGKIIFENEFPRRKRRGINRRILIALRGGVLNLYPPLEDSSAAGGLKLFQNPHGGFLMARITIEDCLRKVSNRFLLVNIVAQRVRQIREGSDYLVSSPKNEDIVVALREAAAGKLVPVNADETTKTET